MTRACDRYAVRLGRASDATELARLQAAVQLQAATGGKPHPGIAAWVDGLLAGHPSVVPDDFLVAEEVATGRPVASLVGLRQDWSLAGVRLPVVQVELVGTAPEHRGNRLTDRLFAALHERCAADGVPVQMIEGVPYFYRRYGYDYAFTHGGAATVPAAALPPSEQGGPDDATAVLTVHPATVANADALATIDRRLAEGEEALVCPRDAAVWRYEITGRGPADFIRRSVAVLRHGDDVRGYLVHGARLSAAGELTVFAATCERPADWPEAAAAMYAYLGRVGRRYAAAEQPFVAVRPALDADHPLVRVGPPGVPKRPAAWYARTGDPVDLLARLRPLLARRWHAADLRWREPALVIDTYGRAARLEFTDGELTAVTAARVAVDPTTDPDIHAAIPPHALLQLALGHRSLPEVLDAWPDCILRDRLTERFLTVAFPRVPVRVWPRN
ncbi:GNAT family N-acetyltransferase [Micromonospora craterilacus]|uniref:GNAT family N-acetyltransferase n=1 Tax=Micromonospora craterilacus TaxID=1655439 RepID=A0A2W2EVK9_9ACTN|nr:GNAT family N-acetyltransferase [Micromonospora craterilacus]PZG20849.1 GNAT family N-acetyltransferase [Micromonospora craterilacus]